VTDTWTVFFAFFVALIALAGMLRFVPRAPRSRVRRAVILLGLYGVCTAAEFASHWLHSRPLSEVLHASAELFQVLLAINLGALLLFDVLLRAVRLPVPDILYDVLLGAGYLIAVAWVMRHAGVNLAGVVATSAVATAVIGLSLQATLGNVVGGLSLQLDDSIHPGDWIELENKTQGLIKEIHWRHTVVETRDWDTLIVPNAQLVGQTIKVLGRRTGQPVQHRMWVYFNVDFRFAPSDVMRIVDDALSGAPIDGVAAEPKPHCICYDFARDGRDSLAYYAVRYWLTDLARDDPTSSRVRERIYAALRRSEVPLAIPATAVFLSKDDPERAERKKAKIVGSKVAALEAVDLFSELSAEEKTQLASSARLSPFSRSEVITRQGAQAHWLYVLIKGRASVRLAADGSEREVATLEAPSFFGEMALMTGQPREATVIAETDVECLRVDRHDFEGILKKRPEMATEISRILAERRVGLLAARDGLDEAARSVRITSETKRILGAIREFFALE
jgi:small-conductance mechanosensitive channel/CRP-like cAMP-binding protein